MHDIEARFDYLQGEVMALQLALGALLASHPDPEAAVQSITTAMTRAKTFAGSVAGILGVESSERRVRAAGADGPGAERRG